MEIRNKTTNIYTEWKPLIDGLPDSEAGKIFKCIFAYQSNETVDFDNPIWLFIKSKIDAYNENGEQISKARSEAGKKGMANRWSGISNNNKCYQMITNDNKNNNKIKENKIKQNKIKENILYNNYGELKNVCLKQEDYEKLLSIHPNLNEAIEVLDTWLGTSGSKNKNKNHYAYFKSNSWVWDRVKPKQNENYDTSWDKYEITN